MKWYLRGCPACGGDLYEDLEDEGWVVCFLCARSFRRDEVSRSGFGARPPRRAAAAHVEETLTRAA